MDVGTQRLSHLSSSNIGDGVQRQTVVELIIVQEILLDAVDDQVQEIVGFVQKQGDGEVADLLFRVFCRRDEIDSLEVTKVDVPSEYVDVQELFVSSAKVFAAVVWPRGWYLADILFLVVPIQIAIFKPVSDGTMMPGGGV